MNTLRVIFDKKQTCYRNMATDEALFYLLMKEKDRDSLMAKKFYNDFVSSAYITPSLFPLRPASDMPLIASSPPTLRFYDWTVPTLSIGYFQKLKDININKIREKGWHLIRRPTGGRGVLHWDEVTFCLTIPVGKESLWDIFKKIHKGIARGLNLLNIPAQVEEGEIRSKTQEKAEEEEIVSKTQEKAEEEEIVSKTQEKAEEEEIVSKTQEKAEEEETPLKTAEVEEEGEIPDNSDLGFSFSNSVASLPRKTPVCFASPSRYELTLNGKKMAGSAQKREKDYMLIHGSIPIIPHFKEFFEILVFRDERTREFAYQSSQGKMTSLLDETGIRFEYDTLCKNIARGFCMEWHLNPLLGSLGQEEEKVIEGLEKKYQDPAWVQKY